MFDPEEFDIPDGEVSEPTTYTPVDKGKYVAKVETAEFTDPVVLGWKPKRELTETETREYYTPFVRLRWRIQADEFGQPCEATGRQVDQKVSLLSGPDMFGRSRAKQRADIIRLRHNLTAKDDVMGKAFYSIAGLEGMDRKSKAAELGRRLTGDYAGLQATIIVAHQKPNDDGEVRDFVPNISLVKD